MPIPQPKAYPDVQCKLCFLPEGDSAFVRVGKYKVRHEDCSGAWPKEEVAKGRQHVFGLQIEREEERLMASAARASEAVAPAEGTAPATGDSVPVPSQP